MARSEWIGKKLSNRYLIEEMLGQGGMSAVYKASDPNLKRVVAIKMIHMHLSSDPDFIQRFEQEASGVAQLRHPRIIQVYDFNQDEGVYYMVLEFVPGENLQDHLKRINEDGRKLSISNVTEYMIDVCDAVDYAHRRGMIHRDIKPANIMLSLTGEAILMDFGIAKIVGSQRHTATGAVVGTAMYMSPEQIKGESPDLRSDIYSLGVTLFEMASGRPPFKADSAMTLMMMHINDPVPDPKKLNPDVPDDLVSIINKALAKDPNDRYQTAAEMASSLRKLLARLNSSSFAERSAPAATMIEEMPNPYTSMDATSLDISPVGSDGTVVESAPHPVAPAPTGREQVDGTAIERHAEPVPSMVAAPLPSMDDRVGTAMERPVAPPVSVPPTPVRDSAPKKSGLSMPIIAGIAVGLACLLFGGIFLVNRLLSGSAVPPAETPTVLVENTAAPTEAIALATLAPETTATPEESSTPSVTPTLANTPTATVPPGIPFVRINSITVDDQARYVVEYETFEYTEVLPGTHIHFYFNTVAHENAGSPA